MKHALSSKSPSSSYHPRNLLYHSHTLYLFTLSDFKTTILPSIAFALFMTFSRRTDQTSMIDSPPNQSLPWTRLPAALCWTWLNTLAININNQRQQSAIEEDRLNKPWRPLPSGRITPQTATALGHATHPTALLFSLILRRGIAEAALLAVLGFLYNSKRYSDTSVIARNGLNALGIPSFAGGALEIISGRSLEWQSMTWLAVMAAVLFTTIHAQDMYDQRGDAAIDRKTVPLVIGDGPARWTIALGVVVWSGLCPTFWRVGWAGYCVPLALGLTVVTRTLMRRTVEKDRRTFKVYNLWLVSLYALPVWRR